MHTCARRECVCECVHFDAPARFHVSLLFPLVSEARGAAEEQGGKGRTTWRRKRCKRVITLEEMGEQTDEETSGQGWNGGTRETDERKMAVGPSCFVRRETQGN